MYAYFYRENDPDGGFAAVPFSEKGNYKAKQRQFDPHGLPLCKAGLAMPLKFTYTDRTTCIVEHERGKYVCPLKRCGSVTPSLPGPSSQLEARRLYGDDAHQHRRALSPHPRP